MNETDSRPRRPALGRGLAALIPAAPTATRDGLLMVDVERIFPDAKQPRQHFASEALEELAQSIREQGILQPLLVRRVENGFVLVAGERRWRAAQRAGLSQVPVLVKDLSDAAAFAVALVENIQRQDLSPLEEAEGFRRLIEDHGLTQEALGKQLGKERSTIANTLRLLKLPSDVRGHLAKGSLSMGHARALLGLESPEQMRELAREIVERNLSVRQTEARVRSLTTPAAAATPARDREENPNARALRESLQRALGSRVSLHTNGKGGSLEIHYATLDELDRLVERLTR